MRIMHHRRFTANHTWHLDWAGRRLFVKANPHHDEARAECAGHARLRAFYPVPALRGARPIARWTVLVYDRWCDLGPDTGLLLDEITQADLTRGTRRLDACLTAVFTHYRHVIARTLRCTTHAETIGKLYGARAAPDGRLDRYYRPDLPWPVVIGGRRLRPSDLATIPVVVNGRQHSLDFDDLATRLRAHFSGNNPVWAAVTQGDPTDVNIGWSPSAGPVWFDYDTGGFNALPGEFACFLLYQRLHGAWLTPHYNPTAFHDHPSALALTSLAQPVVHIERGGPELVINYRHRPSLARRHVLRRYLDEIVHPLTSHLGIDDLMDWIRPYLVMRLLAVYHLADLESRDTALSLALLADALNPRYRAPGLSRPHHPRSAPYTSDFRLAPACGPHPGRTPVTTSSDYQSERTLPNESEHEQAVRQRLGQLLANTPIPPGELVDNLALYLRRQPLTDLLSLDALYRMVRDVPGAIMEFGVHRGRHLAALTALRGVYEPYNPHRRIVGFDTFTGFPDVAEVDATVPSAVPGRFAVPDDYPGHLRAVLDAHEEGEHLRHIRRTLIVRGDVREMLPRYLDQNPQTVIALAYFDLDLYEPTRDTLDAIRSYLTKGSVLAFDELAHAKWPGETAALRDVLGINHGNLRLLPGRATPAYLRWDV